MLDWTDRHERYFLRLISRHALLYTEMITTGAILQGDRKRMLSYHPAEHPVALQLGGSDPSQLATCARIGADFGYDEINLNVGCPSDRVFQGRFGACLMAEPQLVADCVANMRAAVNIPVTVKHRIGIDDRDSYDELCEFVETVASAGCSSFIVHARKAWLQGLNPKQNREIPPLDYKAVAQLKRDYPALTITLNGGLKTLAEVEQQLQQVDGVMMGREAYHNPYLLAEVDRRFYGDSHEIPSRHQVVESFLSYVAEQLQKGTPLQSITRHILGLFQGIPGARSWRRHLSENAHVKGVGIEVILEAAKKVSH